MKGAQLEEDEWDVSLRSVAQERAEAAKIEYSAARAELDAAMAERDVAQMEEEIAAARSQRAENEEGIASASLEFALLSPSGSGGSGAEIGLQDAVVQAQRNSANADSFLKQASIENARAKQEVKRARVEAKRASGERNKALMALKSKKKHLTGFDDDRRIAMEARDRAESCRKEAALARANAERAYRLLDAPCEVDEGSKQEKSPTSIAAAGKALLGGSMADPKKC